MDSHLAGRINLSPVLTFQPVLIWLLEAYGRQRGSSISDPSQYIFVLCQLARVSKHSITFEGSALFNFGSQFSHNPVDMSHSVANEVRQIFPYGNKDFINLNVFLKSGILLHESCSQRRFMFCQKFYFRFRFEGFINKRNHSLHTNKQFHFFVEDYLT